MPGHVPASFQHVFTGHYPHLSYKTHSLHHHLPTIMRSTLDVKANHTSSTNSNISKINGGSHNNRSRSGNNATATFNTVAKLTFNMVLSVSIALALLLFPFSLSKPFLHAKPLAFPPCLFLIGIYSLALKKDM